MGSNINLGSFGVTGVKGSFSLKMLSNSSVLNSMTIRLKHMHYLETSTYVMGSKVNLGSLGVLQKRAGYVSLLRHNLLSSSSSSSSFFFLLSSSFCQHVNISDMLHSILTKLGVNDQYLDRYSHTNIDGVKGHDGVTGVKKVISPKLLFLLQITWYGHVTHAYWSARYPLQKLSV